MPAIQHEDACLETWTGTGTGKATLAGAKDGYRAIPDGTYSYWIRHQAASPAEYETGIGTVASGELLRGTATILSSSNSGSLVNFSAGTKEVGIGPIAAFIDPAPLSAKIGCKLGMSSTQSIPNGSVTDIVWNTTSYDPRGWHSSPSAEVTPDVPGLYQVVFGFEFAAGDVGTRRLYLNNGQKVEYPPNEDGANKVTLNILGRVACNGTTDTIKVQAYHNQGSTLACGGPGDYDAVLEIFWVAPLSTYSGPK